MSALRGDEARCRALGAQTHERTSVLGFRLYQLLASLCLGLLDVGAGRVDDAIGRLEEIARYADERRLYIPASPAARVAEAYVRTGRASDAEAMLRSFDRSQLASAPLFSAHAERCRGLLAGGDAFEAHFALALDLHAHAEPLRARPHATLLRRAPAARGRARAAPRRAPGLRPHRRPAVG